MNFVGVWSSSNKINRESFSFFYINTTFANSAEPALHKRTHIDQQQRLHFLGIQSLAKKPSTGTWTKKEKESLFFR